MDSLIDTVITNIRRDDDASCGTNEYNGMLGARISSVFVVLATSTFGAVMPLLSSKYSFFRMPNWVFFICKFFGSGVIIATAFIHLLEPANDALSNECLGSGWGVYPYAFGICLVTLFLLFFAELCAFRYVDKKLEAIGQGGHSHSHFGDDDQYVKKDFESEDEQKVPVHASSGEEENEKKYPLHFSHAPSHQDPEAVGTPAEQPDSESYYGQLMAIFVLEFGIIFHSVFVGLSLAVAADEFKTLYPVIVFHQLFEGLGLGTRIASAYWPKEKRFTPWLMAFAFGLTTPIAIAIGLGVRQSYSPESKKALITNGIFDSISAGILLYTGIVELMAHEFLYSNEFKGDDGFRRMVWAYLVMCVGAGLMALLGRWA